MDGRITHIKNHLLGNLQSHLSDEEMAQMINVAPSHLRRLFKNETGKTPFQYARDLRLEKAKELLSTTFMRVKEVCVEVGFKDYTHFVRDFKKKYEIFPSELQKKVGLNLPDTIKPTLSKRSGSKNNQFIPMPMNIFNYFSLNVVAGGDFRSRIA